MPPLPEPTYRVDELGRIVVSHPSAWWCSDCGRFRHCNEYGRCDPCETTAVREAQAIAAAVMDRIAQPDLATEARAWGAL